MLHGERLSIAGGGIATVLTFGPPVLSTTLPLIGGVVLLAATVRIAATAGSQQAMGVDRAGRVRGRWTLVAAIAGLGIAVLLQLLAVAESSVVLGLLAAMLRVVALLGLVWVMADMVDEHRVAADPWHRALLAGLCTWLPLLAVLGSAVWHVGTGRSDAAAFSTEGAAGVFVLAAAVVPLLALVPGRRPLDEVAVPAVQR